MRHLEIPLGVKPDWSAARIALSMISEEECEQILAGYDSDYGNVPASEVLWRSIDAVEAMWDTAVSSENLLKCDASLVLLVDQEAYVKSVKSSWYVGLFSASGLASEAGFGHIREHVVASVRQEVATFLKRACERYKIVDNESVLSLASDIEIGNLEVG